MSNIEWHQAHEEFNRKENERLEREERERKEYEENIVRAKDELWDAMATEHFRTSDFSDICSSYGIDEDDLLEELI